MTKKQAFKRAAQMQRKLALKSEKEMKKMKRKERKMARNGEIVKDSESDVDSLVDDGDKEVIPAGDKGQGQNRAGSAST